MSGSAPLALAAVLMLAGCQGSADRQADQLDNAAAQSGPAAAASLHTAADAMRADGAAGAINEAGSTPQNAMANAGAAQSENVLANGR